MFFRNDPKKSNNSNVNTSKTEIFFPVDVLQYIFKFIPAKKLYNISLISKTFNEFSQAILNKYKENIFYTLGAPIKVGEYTIFYRLGALKDRKEIPSKELDQAFHGQFRYYSPDSSEAKYLQFYPPKKPSAKITKTYHKREVFMELFHTEKEAALRADSLIYHIHDQRFKPAIYKVAYLNDTINLEWKPMHIPNSDDEIDHAYVNRKKELIPMSGKIISLANQVLGSIDYQDRDDSHTKENKDSFSKKRNK